MTTFILNDFSVKPQEILEGMMTINLFNYAAKLKGKLLLVHETGDDNVHVQNTLESTEALVQAHKQFDMHLYTNRNHGINGSNTNYHLFTLILNYIHQNL